MEKLRTFKHNSSYYYLADDVDKRLKEYDRLCESLYNIFNEDQMYIMQKDIKKIEELKNISYNG